MAEKTEKQTAVIQTVKAIAVLVIICLVCVALLALLNDLLYVAPPAADDAIAAIHEDFERDTDFDETLNDEFKKNDAYGEVVSVARCKNDGALVLEVIGYGGYQGGTVTIYVVVNSEAKIERWTIKDNVNQSYIGNIPSDVGTKWYIGSDITAEISDFQGVGTHATMSSTAIYNAINMAAYYCRTALKDALGLGEIKDPVQEAQNAAIEILSGTDFASYSLTRYNSFTSIKVDGKSYANAVSDDEYTLTYMFRGTGANGVLFVYVFGNGSDLKVIAVSEGEFVAKSNNVEDTDAIYQNVMTYSFHNISAGGDKILTVVSMETESDATIYTVVSVSSGYVPSNYTLNITISTENGVGTVTNIVITVDGWEDIGGGEIFHEATQAMATQLLGATSATVDSLYDSGKVTGATESANLITAAVKAALAHYDANLAD